MDMNDVLYEERGPIAIITLNREHKLNAMNTVIIHKLIELLAKIDQSEHIHTAILTGKGKAFIAGADIGEYSGQTLEQFIVYQATSRTMYEAIEKNRKPFIAAVNGYALGGGFEIVLSCDLVVASSHAKMGLPEIQLGLLPGGGGTQKLGRLIGRNRAKEFLLTGRRMTAEEAYRLGIVNRVVEPETLMEEALRLAEELAEKASGAVRDAKRLVNEGMETDLSTGLTLEQYVLAYLFQTTDAHEGIRAFVEKRKPQFNVNPVRPLKEKDE
jgi:enoyl-CoA hydratase